MIKSYYFDTASIGQPDNLIRNGKKISFTFFDEYFDQYKEAILSYLGCSANNHIILGRNTSEVINMLFSVLYKEGLNTVFTSSQENQAVYDMCLFDIGYANQGRRYPYSTYTLGNISDNYPIQPIVQNRRISLLKDNFPLHLQNSSLALVSHVSRYTGKVNNDLCNLLCGYTSGYKAIDGAQAFGNIADCRIQEFMDQGIDLYCVSASKFIGAIPLGIAVISDRIYNLLKEHNFAYILNGRVAEDHSLDYNRISSFLSQMSYYEDKGFYSKSSQFFIKSLVLSHIRDRLKIGLGYLSSIKVYDEGLYSPGILSLSYNYDIILPQKNTKSLYGYLSYQGIQCTYLSDMDIIRLGLSESLSDDDLIYFLRCVSDYNSF